MDMTMESLLEAGYNQQQASDILAAHRATLNGVYVPKTRFDDVNQRLHTSEARVQELQEFKEENESLKSQVTQLTTDLATAKTEAQATIAKERLHNAMSSKLANQVYDTDMVLGLVDQSKVSLEDGTLKGFDEQIEELRKNKAFLFCDGNNSRSGGTFFVGGAKPPESQPGNPKPKLSEGEAFAKQLAERRLKEREQLQRGEKQYFK